MIFKVDTEEGVINLTSDQVIDLLVGKYLASEPREDFETLSFEFAKFLQTKHAFTETNPAQLILMSFSFGYLYRIFREKNTVEVESESNNCESNVKSNSSNGM